MVFFGMKKCSTAFITTLCLLTSGIFLLFVAAAEMPDLPSPLKVSSSVDLFYAVKANQQGLQIDGEAVVEWRNRGAAFSLQTQTRVPLLGKILESKSEGAINTAGLAPVVASEAHFGRVATTTFDRQNKQILFSKSGGSSPLQGSEQDHNSVLWQLIAIARSVPEQFKPGSEWDFIVAGTQDAEPWTFKVEKQETLQTAQGNVETVQVVRIPPAGSKQNQQLLIWLAPSQDWYPVQVHFIEANQNFIEQTLTKSVKK